jgi:3-hydroxyisobutyrate dehydrogenase
MTGPVLAIHPNPDQEMRSMATPPDSDRTQRADDQSPETVAILGLGAMGHGLAASASRAGIPTVGWDQDGDRTSGITSLGARSADSAADAVRQAGIVVTMVTDADAVMSIAADQGMLRALPQGAIWVQMSTIGIAGIDRAVDLVERERPDVTLIDAPVSGSREPAEHGQLTIFASGPEAARPRVTPLFDALGHRTVWVGQVGAGTRMKLVNNTLLAFRAEGLATAVAVAHQLGIDTETLRDVLTGGPLMSPWDEGKLERMAKDDYSAQFSLALAMKDVGLALDAVDAQQFDTFSALSREWKRALERGLGDDDVTVVTRALEDAAAAT